MASLCHQIIDKKFVLLYGIITANNKESNERIKYYFATRNDLMDLRLDF